jgi:hypothetical protein
MQPFLVRELAVCPYVMLAAFGATPLTSFATTPASHIDVMIIEEGNDDATMLVVDTDATDVLR